MIVVLQYAHHAPAQPAIIAIEGQPFISNLPSTEVEANDINKSVEKHTLENERIKQ